MEYWLRLANCVDETATEARCHAEGACSQKDQAAGLRNRATNRYTGEAIHGRSFFQREGSCSTIRTNRSEEVHDSVVAVSDREERIRATVASAVRSIGGDAVCVNSVAVEAEDVRSGERESELTALEELLTTPT